MLKTKRKRARLNTSLNDIAEDGIRDNSKEEIEMVVAVAKLLEAYDRCLKAHGKNHDPEDCHLCSDMLCYRHITLEWLGNFDCNLISIKPW